jgi:hypothetical protein
MNLYAASVALLWSTALRMPPLPQPAAGDCRARRLPQAGAGRQRGYPPSDRSAGGRRG